MKKISILLFLTLSIQLFQPPAMAQTFSSKSNDLKNVELAGASPKVPKDTSPSKKDEEWVERSDKAEKFVFTDLPKHLAFDIKDSFWGWGALGFAIGAGASAGLSQKDKSIEYSFSPHALFGKTGDTIINQMGAPYTMAGVSIITTVVGAGIHNEKLKTTGEAMMESLFWSETITIGAKYAFRRDRPDGGKNGFPSGHTAGVFSTATVLQMMYGWKVGIPAYAFASTVALARVDSYQHFPSDVLMAATIGTVIAYGTSRFHKQLHNNFVIMPEMSKDRYGLVLYRNF